MTGAQPGGYKAPTCTCGHAAGDHKASPTTWPHNPTPGFCLIEGCTCKAWVSAASPEPYDRLSDEYAESVQELPRIDWMTGEVRRRSLSRLPDERRSDAA